MLELVSPLSRRGLPLKPHRVDWSCGKECGGLGCYHVPESNMAYLVERGQTTIGSYTKKSVAHGYNRNTLEQLGIEYDVPLVTSARRVYTAVALGLLHNKMDVAKEIVAERAETMAAQLLMSCIGESRYVSHIYMHSLLYRMNNHHGRVVKSSPMGVFVSKHFDTGATVTRDYAVLGSTAVDEIGGAPYDHVQLARMVRTVLRDAQRDSAGIAGPAWYYGAHLLYQYYSGKISPLVFVDSVFDQIHNNGNILNKVTPRDQYAHLLQSWLDYKRRASVEDLALWAPNDVRRKMGLAEVEHPIPTGQIVAAAKRRWAYNTRPPGMKKVGRRHQTIAEWWHETGHKIPGHELVFDNPEFDRRAAARAAKKNVAAKERYRVFNAKTKAPIRYRPRGFAPTYTVRCSCDTNLRVPYITKKEKE